MQSNSCEQCLQAMSRGKSETLARIACANCQQAREDLAQGHGNLHELTSRSVLGSRCSHCGKWFLTKNALATHLRTHLSPIL